MSKKVVDYCVIRGQPTEVETKVKQLLLEGWELNGQLNSFQIDSQIVLVQGMVNRNKEV